MDNRRKSDVLWNSGKYYLEQREFSVALDNFLTAIALFPERKGVYFPLGCAYMGLGRWYEAGCCLYQVVKQGRKDEYSYFFLATCLDALGKYKWARYYYRKTLSLNPNHPIAHMNLAILWQQAKCPGMAKVHAYRAVELNPISLIPRWGLWMILVSQGELKMARDVLWSTQ